MTGSRRSHAAALLVELGHEDPLRREQALRALAEPDYDLLSRPEVTRALAGVARDAAEAPRLRVFAALHAVLGSEADEGLEELEALAASDDVEVRWRAVEALAELTPAIPDLLDVLDAATRDPSEAVRARAEAALAAAAS